MSRVIVSIDNHIATVTLTRSDKMNALDTKMISELIEAGARLRDMEALRAVVLCGEGKAFCAGLDVMSFAGFAGQDPETLLLPRTHGLANDFQQVALVWRDLEVPVIAALNGVCYGGGLQIALGADIRIAEPGTKLAIMEMKWGLIPDMGGMVLLPRLMRSDQMRKLIYTAAPVDAEEAKNLGLVTEIAENALARALALAGEIAAQSPSAIKAAKALIGLAESDTDEETLLREESLAQSKLIGRPHQMEVISANLQKRVPRF